jgi:hypothetical protein
MLDLLEPRRHAVTMPLTSNGELRVSTQVRPAATPQKSPQADSGGIHSGSSRGLPSGLRVATACGDGGRFKGVPAGADPKQAKRNDAGAERRRIPPAGRGNGQSATAAGSGCGTKADRSPGGCLPTWTSLRTWQPTALVSRSTEVGCMAGAEV